MADGLKLPTSGDFAKHKNFIASRKGRGHGYRRFFGDHGLSLYRPACRPSPKAFAHCERAAA
jgi:hypothetical protein